MNPQTVQATFGCLLHDVGKAVCRAGISDGRHGEAGYRFVRDIDGYGQAKAVLDCIRYHHAAQLRQAKDCDPLAAIACIADNIAAAADRRQTGDETQFDRYLPLSPVFTHLNGEHPGHTLPPHALDGRLRLPLDGSFRLSAGDYEQILLTLRRELSALPPREEWLNSLLSVWESCMSTVPSSTNTGESPDISLYDHSKVTAAVGACISEYLLDRGETDYFTALVQQEQSFRLQQAFLLYSADFSGIQKFIYSVSTRNALKSLRSRSFFLELCMEHYIDELLQLCGLSRANLLYSGGGHCYVLLPNTEKAVRAIQAWNTRFNDFLIEQFGVRLYLADGYTPCSANDLTNTPAEEAPLSGDVPPGEPSGGKKEAAPLFGAAASPDESEPSGPRPAGMPDLRQDRRPARRGGEYLHLPLVRPVREPVPENPGTGCVCGQPRCGRCRLHTARRPG